MKFIINPRPEATSAAFTWSYKHSVDGLPWFRADEEVLYMIPTPRNKFDPVIIKVTASMQQLTNAFAALGVSAQAAGDAMVKMLAAMPVNRRAWWRR